jgi:predicted acyltransferase
MIPSTTAPGPRLTSLDALRGFDMFWILGADSFVYALHGMSPNPVTRFLALELDHAEWAGFHFYDLIFPTFVFIMGVSTVFSLTRILQREGRPTAVRRILIRGLLIFIIGLIYSGGLMKPWPDMRLMGVLNRIALCYVFGGLAFCFLRPRALAALAVSLLLGYWALMALVPFPDVRPIPGGDAVITKEAGFTDVSQLNMASTHMLRGSYVQGVNLANYVDQRFLPGRKYDGTYDPEGILSTLPAFVTGLLGIFAGLLLLRQDISGSRKSMLLVSAGFACIAVGLLWSLEFPIIKKLWTSSYVLVAGGCSTVLLGVFHWVIDVRKRVRWAQPFVWIGMNPITLYMASALLGGFPDLAERIAGGSLSHFLDEHVATGSGGLAVSVVGVLLFVLLARFLYKRSIFIRL